MRKNRARLKSYETNRGRRAVSAGEDVKLDHLILDRAWARVEEHSKRRVRKIKRIEAVVDWSMDYSPELGVTAVMAIWVAVLAVIADTIAPSSRIPGIVAAAALFVLACSFTTMLLPLPLAAAAALTRAFWRLKVASSGRRAVRDMHAEQHLPLGTALWSVKETSCKTAADLPEVSVYTMMSRRFARATAARYGKHALPAGRLHDVCRMSPRAIESITQGWEGSAEKFLETVGNLPESEWKMLLEIAENLSKSNVSSQKGAWVNDLACRLGETVMSKDQKEILRRLMLEWRGSATDLVDSARAL